MGLSGGVDSAVSAYLLKKEGYRVVGAFVKVWEPPWLSCTSREDRLSAMRVAAHLEIPFVTYDCADIYKREVVDAFVAEYQAGRTPNPDVLCNRAIKFGALWERAQADGADMIATGHYAQKQVLGARFQLLASVDKAKDQTYFLWMLTQDDLAHALFPVGGMLKSEVREVARRAKLPNAARRDSQGLCFLGHVDMKEFLMRELGVGRDDPRLYTVGEKVNGAYVMGRGEVRTLLIEHTNWINTAPLGRVLVQIRYHGPFHDAVIDGTSVMFTKPVLAAPGQSLVVYDANTGECRGGGIIA